MTSVYGEGDVGARMAVHIAAKYGVVAFVSYNLSADETLLAWAEKKLFEKVQRCVLKMCELTPRQLEGKLKH